MNPPSTVKPTRHQISANTKKSEDVIARNITQQLVLANTSYTPFYSVIHVKDMQKIRQDS
jgi:hypothetical protein